MNRSDTAETGSPSPESTRVSGQKFSLFIFRPSNSLENMETPPPTYDEYVKTADLYVKYHRNGNYSTTSALSK
ncbi:hypothetical protein Y032_0084g1731 [Ancylostoma ceylanicum]|uniref:Uncharacterized protein n=1 Tax=Ancylostoma ceylanicum TaxID=53326 RepID=A0A016TQJ5_9BILA|nr:hypothetical protein Y032_0084g1731 [Ancylostoma ceylanicum]